MMPLSGPESNRSFLFFLYGLQECFITKLIIRYFLNILASLMMPLSGPESNRSYLFFLYGLQECFITKLIIRYFLNILASLMMPLAGPESNIGITHVFSCINICRDTRKLFEHEAARLSVQILSEGPGKC